VILLKTTREKEESEEYIIKNIASKHKEKKRKEMDREREIYIERKRDRFKSTR